MPTALPDYSTGHAANSFNQGRSAAGVAGRLRQLLDDPVTVAGAEPVDATASSDIVAKLRNGLAMLLENTSPGGE